MVSKIYFIAGVCFVLILNFKHLQSSQVSIRRLKIESKLPVKNDLIQYLGAVNRIIDFSGKRESKLDINVYFGLFLVNVNLNRALRDKQRVMPQKLKTYMKKIIRNTENLLDIFKERIENNYDLRNNKYKAIFSLFANASSWINRLPKFFARRLNETVPYLEKVNRKWVVYRKNVDDRNAWIPNPHQSDLCLTSLASANEVQIGDSRRCRVLKFCFEMVKKGTDLGYALAHRLLFLQQAKFGRGCSVFSEQEDEQIRQRFCSAAYQEVQYITTHNFEIVDLLLEYVCLCSLEGYVQFLRRSWLTKILSFQTIDGCFTPCSQSGVCKLTQAGDYGSDGYCNGHTTAVAAGTLAMASRFILQFYY